MTKTPPHRRGITFQVGAPLEARDSLKNWYAASIEKIDYEDEKVLIHYRQWSHRYDEWFDWSSPYLRPVERIQLRKQGLRENSPAPGFHVNQKVLASWSDCRYYPAKILTVNRDSSYTVKFYDGVVKTVKGIKIKPFRKESSEGRTGQYGRRRSDSTRKDWKPRENGSSRSNGSRHSASASDQDAESESEDEEEVGKDMEEDRNLTNGSADHDKVTEGANGGEHQNSTSCEEDNGGEPTKTERKGEIEDCHPDKSEVNGVGEENGSEGNDEEKKEKEDGLEDSAGLARRTRSRQADGKDAESKPNVPELRKRRASLGQTPPAKRNRANSSTDRSSRSQSQKLSRSDSVPATASPEERDCKGPMGTAEATAAKADTGATPDLATLLRRQVHLPTTNKYSREPLYRVIKNQPPPILSIELDHNPFKCKAPGCLKSFRKASLLHYHMKYYHAECDLSPPRSVQTRASDKQNSNQETPRRRRTVSASLHTPSPLNDSKSGHTPSPPTANGVHRQRSASQCERSKENQHTNRKNHDDRDWNAMETAGMKERERLREKRQKDFLRIKLKKKKKKKKRSKSDCHSSQENIGSKPSHCPLNLALKLPLSHKHHNYMDKTYQDGEDSGSDWSTDSTMWSEEESETGLDVITPISEQGVEPVSHGSEIVRCVCEVQEENDFMIQCEECLCWQHGTCMGLMEDSVPDTYTCYICRDPPAQRQSQRYWYDKDWLSSGHMYGLSFLEENYSHQNSRKISATHQLLGDVHRVFQVLNGLQLKMSILQTQAHPDLKLWRTPWKQNDVPRRKGTGDSAVATPSPSIVEELIEIDNIKRETPSPLPTVNRTPSFQDSYISSEHCYQKPRTYYPAVEQRLVVETRGGSELEDSLRSTEDLLEMEQRYGCPLEPDQAKIQFTDQFSTSKDTETRKKAEKSSETEVKMENPDPLSSSPDPDLLLHQQWQLNLLDHIEAVQDEVTHRMDLIERELDVLESWLDYTGELEPPDPLARLPQLKHRIRQLLTDLGTVQQLAVCSSST
ncbi:PHD finger protein 20b isoform X2 [Chanos chanos]|uniref:PHD finger protein 20b isoform X2 n=1 Tax=Chanos chanos TaxID=29144 RepID=A0A6J2UWD2_CHACN|nr:PHD finger protein 20-like isoform X2 [Chanos chanos]